jgi:hypothetical protein
VLVSVKSERPDLGLIADFLTMLSVIPMARMQAMAMLLTALRQNTILRNSIM